MSIELLWIIPVVAVAMFFLILILSAQKSREGAGEDTDSRMHHEVEQFNRGLPTRQRRRPDGETRLREIEKTIGLVTTALSTQQTMLESYQGKGGGHAQQLNDLKEMLQKMQHEYDILLSENFSLRARITSLTKGSSVADGRDAGTSHGATREDTDMLEAERIHQARLYDDTRTFSKPKPGGTSEIDLSKLR